ncbi:glycosyltransferase family 4 protein [Plicaturopsis crispa FD-325 SS-3]|nr:glycosyltransferase family 4 protein [Plicaturopsis crispa FD-325 SS-3]
MSRPLRVAFIHPDLGIGGAERLVVDAALGLQALGNKVAIYTSHHDPNHCFDETRDGRLQVHNVIPPFPRSVKGKFHILLAHARQLHLTAHLLLPSSPEYDVYFVDQLSTCIPFLRAFAGKRVLFYCHFPDKLLANGAFVEDKSARKKVGLLKAMYRFPMDWVEEITTRQADVILANSKFTARIFKLNFTSIKTVPKVVYPGINISAYETALDMTDPDIQQIISDQPTLLSINRFEKKKNIALAISSFALLRKNPSAQSTGLRLVIAGGYDPRLEDNMMTLVALIDAAKAASLTYNIVAPSTSRVTIPPFNTTPSNPDILFLLNFTTAQRSALLNAPAARALLYTPTNEHFGIGPVEGMVCGVPVLATDTGGPTESIVDVEGERTGWLRAPDAALWAEALAEIVALSAEERAALAARSRDRARNLFGMEAMAKGLDGALREAVAMGPVRASMLWLLVPLLLAYALRHWLLS